jgi:hypothetical protein
MNRYDSIAALDLSAYTLVVGVSLALQPFNASVWVDSWAPHQRIAQRKQSVREHS